MKIKALLNPQSDKHEIYGKFLEHKFPEILAEENPDMYLVVGGDGAMLHAHRDYGVSEKVFFGKGFGTLNFVMNNFDNDSEIIQSLLDGSLVPDLVKTEKIKIIIKKADGTKIKKEAINDIVIGNEVMDWHKFNITSSDGSFKNLNFKGMGLCVATPLGSTAFNLNNGGRVLPIESELWSITGIVSDHKIDEIMAPCKLSIKIESERHVPKIFIDGVASSVELGFGDIVTLKKCKKRFTLSFIDKKEFIGKRMKLIQSKR